MPLASAYRGTSPFAFEGRAQHKRALASKGHYQEGPGGRQDLSSHMHGALQSWALVARAGDPHVAAIRHARCSNMVAEDVVIRLD